MEHTLYDTLMQSQWVAVWISMLFTVLSAIVALTDSDSRKKRLLRDIQILDGLKDYGDPFYISILQDRIKQEFEDISKPRLFGPRARVFFILYFAMYACWTVAAYTYGQFTLCAVNIAGILIIAVGILLARLKLKNVFESSKKENDLRTEELSAKAKPAIKIIAGAIQRGISEDEITRILGAETQAIEVYANMFPSNPADRAYIKQILASAAEELKHEETQHDEVEASETKEA